MKMLRALPILIASSILALPAFSAAQTAPIRAVEARVRRQILREHPMARRVVFGRATDDSRSNRWAHRVSGNGRFVGRHGRRRTFAFSAVVGPGGRDVRSITIRAS